jgi:hypothetical protein
MAAKQFKGKILAKGTEIAVISKGSDDAFISLTDIAKYKNADEPFIVINNWMRLRIGTPLNILVFGKDCIIQTLNLSNSIGFCTKLALIHLPYLLQSGQHQQTQ